MVNFEKEKLYLKTFYRLKNPKKFMKNLNLENKQDFDILIIINIK